MAGNVLRTSQRMQLLSQRFRSANVQIDAEVCINLPYGHSAARQVHRSLSVNYNSAPEG
jgi:hypothetical protein